MSKIVGVCVWFDVKKGYGFVRASGATEDIFVHYSKIKAEPGVFRTLEQGDRVEFEMFEADRGNGSTKLQAKDVQVIGGENEISGKNSDQDF